MILFVACGFGGSVTCYYKISSNVECSIVKISYTLMKIYWNEINWKSLWKPFFLKLKFTRKRNNSFTFFCEIQFRTLTLKSRKYIQTFFHFKPSVCNDGCMWFSENWLMWSH